MVDPPTTPIKLSDLDELALWRIRKTLETAIEKCEATDQQLFVWTACMEEISSRRKVAQ